MRHLPLPPAATLALAALATPALVALPTVARPTPPPHAVGTRVAAVPLHGVDAGALATLTRAAATAGLAPALAPVLRKALAGEFAANPIVPAAPRPAVLTGELTPAATGTSHFDLVAASWDRAAGGAKVQVRVREAGGWTDWQPLDGDGDGPDASSPEAARGPRATAPLLTTGADAVQVRVDTASGRAPAGLRIDLVDGGDSDADAPAAPAASAAAATPAPTIITRKQWGADERLVTGTTSYDSSIKALFVHHTDTTNGYTAAQGYAQVRAIYAFHTKVRGWNDIGYNLLVDRFGHVFEGRRGSITSAVLGAHTGGFNSQSLGIAVLGTFSKTAPSSAAMQALASTLAWKAAQYQIDPRTNVRLTSAGGYATAHPAGERVRVATISSHRDVGLTECPGDALWAQLPWLRRELAARMAPGLVAPAASAAAVQVTSPGVTVTGTIPTTQRWTLTATSVCGTVPVRTVRGLATARISATWNLRDAKNVLVPPGSYHLALATGSPVGAATTWTTDVEVLPVDGGAAGTCPVRRVVATEGAGAVQRAVAVGRSVAPNSTTVVLAGLNAAATDGVVAAPLAHALGAPLLLTDAAALSPAVATELRRRKATRVVVIGGTTAVTPAVLTALHDLGVPTVERIGGATAYATAAAVAQAFAAVPRPPGSPAPTGVLLAPLHYGKLAHAATLGSLAAATGRPVLYLTSRGFPTDTVRVMRALGITSATVVGGTDEFSDRAARGFTTLHVATWTRVIGTARAGVALALARAMPADPAGAPGAAWAGAPTDAGIPDVVAAGAAGRPVLLLPAVVTGGIGHWFTARRPRSTWVLGGTAQVPAPLFASLTAVTR
jgi:putative cell wall-binding protein